MALTFLRSLPIIAVVFMVSPTDESGSKAVNAARAMGFVWEVLISIAIPTTLFALGGRWLDTRWHTSPWFVLIGLVLSFLTAGALVMRKAKNFRL